ncbi:4-hydroxythreonine-4-phosphate dehydrogenase PdxA, partial [bacterium]|nr:4-hydroxythreonine-4-phosphate dehydrogenase PdxA [bacterium]
QWFRVINPRIGVAALNPHASDGGIFGNEEKLVIEPAIEIARVDGLNVTGPFPADTLFPRYQQFDGILAMYHDQGMIPVKMAGFGKAVNLTGGLPFPRTSPDHGTAFDIAGKMRADAGSMLEAILTAMRTVDNVES